MTRAQLTRQIQRTGLFTTAQARIAAEMVLDRLRVLLLTTPKGKQR